MKFPYESKRCQPRGDWSLPAELFTQEALDALSIDLGEAEWNELLLVRIADCGAQV